VKQNQHPGEGNELCRKLLNIQENCLCHTGAQRPDCPERKKKGYWPNGGKNPAEKGKTHGRNREAKLVRKKKGRDAGTCQKKKILSTRAPLENFIVSKSPSKRLSAEKKWGGGCVNLGIGGLNRISPRLEKP